MKISELIQILQEALLEHGDLPITGVHHRGHPEMTITHWGYAPDGPLANSSPSSDQVDPAERFILDWEDL